MESKSDTDKTKTPTPVQSKPFIPPNNAVIPMIQQQPMMMASPVPIIPLEGERAQCRNNTRVVAYFSIAITIISMIEVISEIILMAMEVERTSDIRSVLQASGPAGLAGLSLLQLQYAEYVDKIRDIATGVYIYSVFLLILYLIELCVTYTGLLTATDIGTLPVDVARSVRCWTRFSVAILLFSVPPWIFSAYTRYVIGMFIQGLLIILRIVGIAIVCRFQVDVRIVGFGQPVQLPYQQQQFQQPFQQQPFQQQQFQQPYQPRQLQQQPFQQQKSSEPSQQNKPVA